MRIKTWIERAGLDDFLLLGGLALFSVALLGFVELADDVVGGEHPAFDEKILLAFRQADNPAVGAGPARLAEMARDVTALGSGVALALLTLLVTGFLVLRRRHRTAGFVATAVIGGALLTTVVKNIIGRERPTIVPHLMEETSLSFPSGHSMSSTVVYFTLAAILARTVARRREKLYLIGAAAFLSILVGVSRVYMGVHYPTDVIAGWTGGTAWALLCALVARWLQRRGQLRTPPEVTAAQAREDARETPS